MIRAVSQSYLLVVLLLIPTLSLAHAFPDHSQPAKDGVLAAAPSTVRIWFTSDIEPLFNKLVVKNSANDVVSDGKARIDSHNASLLEVPLKALAAGRYRVSWQVTAKDGHRSNGSYTFTVKAH